MQLSIGRLRGGFCVYWTDETGKRRRHQLEARTRAEAEAEAIDVFRRHTTPRTGYTVTDIWEAYRADLGSKPTAKTMGYTGKAILPHFGAYRPDQITKDHCRAYSAARQKTGISIGSIHTELGHLQSALKFAAKSRMIEHAPHIARPPKPTPKERFLTPSEITRLIDSCSAPHIRLAVILLLGTAARVGAILDLTWDRVDLERAQINLRLDDATTRKGRAVVPINVMVRAALIPAREAALTDHVIEHGGKPVKSIRKGFSTALTNAKLNDVTLHTLRHTAAVHMVSAGIPIEKVAQYLGHSNPSITYSTYARFAPDHLTDAAEILNFTKVRKTGS